MGVRYYGLGSLPPRVMIPWLGQLDPHLKKILHNLIHLTGVCKISRGGGQAAQATVFTSGGGEKLPRPGYLTPTPAYLKKDR